MKTRFLSPYLVLFVIFLFALSVRLFWLDKAPRGALIDEAHFGYIAKSLIVTGQDEHGIPFPLIFKGFGDQKLPAYAYVLVPFVWLFDLSVTTIRLPSAIVGALSVGLLFGIVKKVTGSDKAGLTTAVLMAISPWPFFLSRIGFESNLAVFFMLVGLNGLVRYREHRIWAALGGIAMGLTWYAYIAYRPITLLLMVAWALFICFKQKKIEKKIIPTLIAFSVVILPFIIGSNTANDTRFKQVGILSDQGIVLRVDEKRGYCAQHLPQVWCYTLYNKGTEIIQQLSNRYFEVYAPQYMATQGEFVEHFLTTNNYGQFYPIFYPFLLLGIAFLLMGKTSVKAPEVKVLLLLGLLIAPLPSILVGYPQKVRISPLLPFAVIAITLGLQTTWRLLINYLRTDKRLKKWTRQFSTMIALIMAGAVLGYMVHYFTMFFTVHTWKNDHMYQTYVRDLMPFLHAKKQEGYQIFIQPQFSDPLMFYAFYTNMDPREYQRQAVLGVLEPSGFQHTVGLDDLYVTEDIIETIGCEALQTRTPTLFVTKSKVNGARALYTGKGSNMMEFIFVYDALAHAKMNLEHCKQLTPAEIKEVQAELQQQTPSDSK